MPVMRLRVVCGRDDTIESFVPTRRLSSVDLPALGRPMRATNPARIARRGASPPFRRSSRASRRAPPCLPPASVAPAKPALERVSSVTDQTYPEAGGGVAQDLALAAGHQVGPHGVAIVPAPQVERTLGGEQNELDPRPGAPPARP